MMIYPAPHYSMGGLWVDYDAADDHPRPVRDRRGELLRPRRQPARRQRDDAVPRRRLLHPPHTVTDYLRRASTRAVDTDHPAFAEDKQDRSTNRVAELLDVGGSTPATGLPPRDRQCHARQLRHHPRRGRPEEAIGEIREIRDEFWSDLRVDGSADDLNQSLEYAGRVADFLEFGELMCHDAIERDESAGCHLREEHQTEDGEALRDDEQFANVQVWEHNGDDGRTRSPTTRSSASTSSSRATRSYK